MEFVCSECPRHCGALRTDCDGGGYCKAPSLPRIARAALHFWEEPCISGTRGSGTVFFTGCSLGCVYCQNYSVSHENYGKTVTVSRLADIFDELIGKGAHNINLITPTHYAHILPSALAKVENRVPVVYNTGGYDSVETLRSLSGNINIYLADMKYYSSSLAKKLSDAPDYFNVATSAIKEMLGQTGEPEYDDDGIMLKGVIVRHLVLPGHTSDSLKVLSWCRDNLPKGTPVSVMSQYTPMGHNAEYPPLDRRLKKAEYTRVARFLTYSDGFEGYMQELSSAKEEYVPPFNLEGV